ncbi:protein kinase/lanthionine synthetase C family protein [Streptomyces asoensis]|uniref:Protein kinase/lanthionine synthetase C family protein n=1 Tax=Streptomyces asoensis TaxID=249586 RepID=A0A6M4WUW5_9ACTN|nr:class III lanthionine synthetase LanKC [Streptomyces asoensis]QJT03879.1 protein kinase/lanthionine synthetase C family protein [Streptomyces asoensis]
MLDFRFLEFCRPDKIFYDVPDTEKAEDDFEVSLPQGWGIERGRDWTVCRPSDPTGRPEQGWKIHVAGTLDTAHELLGAVVPYLVERGVMFKFIRSAAVLRRRNSKNGERTASGKFITVYPHGDRHTEQLLHGMEELVGGTPGPYILTDLRWKQGPLYVRYGAYVWKSTRDVRGVMVPAMTGPDGSLVPDERRPVFRPPSWLEIPAFLHEALEARKQGTLADFPFRIRAALHFSNGGGIYRATEIGTGRDVLLREARPWAGVDAEWGDAVTRMKREHWALERLRGLPCIPEVIAYVTGHEHDYLAREYVEGASLTPLMATRHPYATGDRSAEACRAYRTWALNVLRRVEDGLNAMHERGVVFGDLSLANVLVTDSDQVRFIDLETATPADEAKPQTLGSLGFRAPEHLTGCDIDRYALAVLKLALFIPVPQAVPWGARKVRQLVDQMVRDFEVPAEFVDSILAWLSPENLPTRNECAVTWPERAEHSDLEARIAGSVVAAATTDRMDRLYPGDPMQFMNPGGGIAFAFGAAGTLWALSRTGHTVPADHVQWLVDRVKTGEDGDGPGFTGGLAGLSHALDALGEHELATDVLERALARADEQGVTDSFATGRSGLALAALFHHQVTRDAKWLDAAVDLAARMEQGPHHARRVGLLHGRTGPALLHMHLHRATGDPASLAWAAAELSRDLQILNRARRIGPGLDGTGGMAVVARAAVRFGADELRDAHEKLVRSLDQIATGFGLWGGRAGTVLARADHGLPTDAHVHSLGWDAVFLRDDSVDFIGDRRFRLSTDLSTGSVAALLALASTREQTTVFPFLGRDLE